MDLIKTHDGYVLDMPAGVLAVIQKALDTQIKAADMLIREFSDLSMGPAVVEALREEKLEAVNVQNFIDSCK